MDKRIIEAEAIKYSSNMEFGETSSLNKKGELMVIEWGKEDFTNGANWMKEEFEISITEDKIIDEIYSMVNDSKEEFNKLFKKLIKRL